MDLTYLFHSLLRKKWIIIFCTLLGLTAGLVFAFFKQKEYVSLAQYSTGFTMSKKVSINQEEGFNIYEIDMRFSNLIETFRSDKVMGMLSYKLLLNDLQSTKPFRTLTSEQKKKPEYTDANLDKVKQILRKKVDDLELISPYNTEEKKVWDLIHLYGYDNESMQDRLAFERAGRTDFINIFFRSENPELSAYVVNTIGDQFIRFFNSIYGVRTQLASTKLDSLTEAKRQEVDTLTKRLENFRNKIGPSSGQEKATAAMGVVQELYTKYQDAVSKRSNLQAEMNAIDSQLKNIVVPGTPAVTNNNREVLRLQQLNADLEKQKNGKTDAEIRKLQEDIDNNTKKMLQLSANASPGRADDAKKLKEKRDDLVNRKIELQFQIAAAETQEKQFAAEKKTYEDMVKEGGGNDVVLKQMESDLDLAKTEYENLRKGVLAARDVDINPENNIRQTLSGQPAYKPVPTRWPLIMGLSAVLSFLLSGMLLVFLEIVDTSYKTSSIFQRLTHLPVLSAVNKVELKRIPVGDYFQAGNQSAGNGYAENLRKLRFELERSGKKIILVTSTQTGEGKSTIIESLAHSLSLAKKRVLVVDANFSNNTLTQKFNAQEALERFSINGQPNPQSAIEQYSTPAADIPQVDVIGCSGGIYSPLEILPKNNLLENLVRVSAHYDFILIEGAALNAHSDSKELSKYAEGIVAVFSAKSQLKQTDKDSVEFLRSTGDKFIGAILNNVEKENIGL